MAEVTHPRRRPAASVRRGPAASVRRRLRVPARRPRVTVSGALWTLLALLVLAALASRAWTAMYTHWAAYDDEGSMLVQISEFLRRGGLYDETISEYGPLHVLTWAAFFELTGLDVTHNTGRALTWLIWLASSALCGVAAWRAARSRVLGLLVTIVVFEVLIRLINEPVHPLGLTSLLLSVTLALAATLLGSRPAAGVTALGAVVGYLALTKVNVGVFAGVALVFALAVAVSPPRLRPVPWVAGGLLVVTPIALVWQYRWTDWIQTYAVVVACAAAAVVVTAIAQRGPASSPGPPAWVLRAVAGGAAVAVVASLAALVTGSTPNGLIHGALLDAREHHSEATMEIARLQYAGGVQWTFIGLGVALVLWLLGPALADRGPSPAGAWARIGAGVVMVMGVIDTTLFGLLPAQPSAQFAVALPLAWVAAIPATSSRSRPGVRLAHAYVAALAVLQTLHAYPVAGSQVSAATFSLAVAGAFAIASGWDDLRLLEARGLPALPGARLGAAVSLLLSAFLLLQLWTGVVAGRPWDRSSFDAAPRLAIDGADRLRLDAATSGALVATTRWVQDHCSTFASVPGLNSFHVFAGVPPAAFAGSAWPLVYDDARQQAILDQFRGRERACVIHSPAVMGQWGGDRPVPDRPLYRYLMTEFATVDEFGPFEVRLPRAAARVERRGGTPTAEQLRAP